MTHSHLGNFILVLHSHLPYVTHHGRWPHGMEWLFEAASETYIPLLNMLNDLIDDGYEPRMTISISPVLAEQLSHAAFVREFGEFLDEEIRRADVDVRSFQTSAIEKQLVPAALFWQEYYRGIRRDFREKYDHDLIGAFRRLLNRGNLDIITCGATHGYFPLLGTDASIQAQVRLAVRTHEKHFWRKPRGIWIPECAYRPRYEWTAPVSSALGRRPHVRKGVEEILDENGLQYFIVDSSLVEHSKIVPMYHGRFENLRRLMAQGVQDERPYAGPSHSVYESYLVKPAADVPERPVAVFARDVETSMQVWSSEQGYPGGEWYLDFHKKHHQSGHRYWRVTSPHADLGQKAIYEPGRINKSIEEDADHFVESVKKAMTEFREVSRRQGTLTAPFDSELFGHWWFEGPSFLKRVFEKLLSDPEIGVTNCAQTMDQNPPRHAIVLPEGSWGAGGNHYVWLNGEVQWMWERIYDCEATIHRLALRLTREDDQDTREVARQLVRELLLLQASDWPFLISTKSATDYAVERFEEHYDNFKRLASQLTRKLDGETWSDEDRSFLALCREVNFLFDDESIEPMWYVQN